MNKSTGYEPTYTWSQMQQQIDLAVKKEREAVLDLVDSYAKNNDDLRDAIRARS